MLLCTQYIFFSFTVLCFKLILQPALSLLVLLQICCNELTSRCLRGVVEVGDISSSMVIPQSYLNNFYQSRENKLLQCIPQSLWTAQCLSRPENALLSQGVCIPPNPSHPGRGSWERGPKADLSQGTQTAACLCCPKWSYGKYKQSFIIHNNMLYWLSFM